MSILLRSEDAAGVGRVETLSGFPIAPGSFGVNNIQLAYRPWKRLADSQAPSTIFDAAGMLVPNERKLLWWLTRNYWGGAGAVVDAGAFCGASAVCLAHGLRENPAWRRRGSDGSLKPVVSYDKFTVDEPYTRSFIKERFGKDLSLGDSFLDIFERQTKDFADIIAVDPGDFLQKRWIGEPIEILFIDVCKTPSLSRHLVGEFFSAMIPGRTLLIQQDFLGAWLPHIHWTMQYYKDYFEILDMRCGPTRLYRLVQPIPRQMIDNVAENRIDLHERIRLLQDLEEQSLVASDLEIAALAEVLRVREFAMSQADDQCDHEWLKLATKYKLPLSPKDSDVKSSKAHWILVEAIKVRIYHKLEARRRGSPRYF